jgi:ankyrin repeat protein
MMTKDIVELLLANHADVNAVSERTVVNTDPSLALYEVRGGWTPYHMAEAKDHKDVAELLRQHGGHE